ncbi:UNVERIFIED_CONTAM: hypothetical protein Cloal_0709 [Acetivibrio alkalicellulosi]
MTCIKNNSNQILEPCKLISDSLNLPTPTELVWVQIPKIFDHIYTRGCIKKTIQLSGCPVKRSSQFSFKGISNYDIFDIKIVSDIDLLKKPGFKKINLNILMKFNINFLNGDILFSKREEVEFSIIVDEIYCPSSIVEPCLLKFSKSVFSKTNENYKMNETYIDVEAIPELMDSTLHPEKGILYLEIGAFFIIDTYNIVRLLIPSYGHYALMSEKNYENSSEFSKFYDKEKYPFPTRIFPLSKKIPFIYR